MIRAVFRNWLRNPWFRSVALPYLLLAASLLVLAIAVGFVAGDALARAIHGSRHIGEALGVVLALLAVRPAWRVLALRALHRWIDRRRQASY